MTLTEPRSVVLRTEIPGPRSRAIVARRDAATPVGLYKAHPIAIDHANGALVTDVDGNVVSGYSILNVSAYLRLGSKTPALSNKPIRPPVEGLADDAVFVLGHCISPLVLPSTITGGTWADAKWSGKDGKFYLEAPIGTVFGRGGLGATIEKYKGTKISGWFQFLGGNL